ncbi:hypothetical protein BASA50_001202 [Batrachochytrium salamandrivorans]|uniref:non-specific serine/threonine protein kinase n=1 Tax=Batrachochytrium salamandrivorans TaxID=1357716 RepID=A0ABQ8ERX2_9FUNG|nr:hypothetical protein BASA50_001202 [Batrachochytrium salamandrivorans]
MFDPLLWVLHHFVTHYAGQTNQGNTNEGDGVDQASGSKDVPKQDTSLPQRADHLSLKRPLQESNTPDQSGTSSLVDLQPGNECTGGHGIRKIPSPCPQQPSLPEPQPSTFYDAPQSDEIPLPARVERLAAEFYNQNWESGQYNAFIAGETKYFESEYRSEKELGKGGSGVVYLATRKSDGRKIAYKSIPKSKVYIYASESSPPLICHLRNPLAFLEEPSAAQCRSSRSPNILLPYEFILQKYLSRPGYENPYVPVVFDYYTLKYEYVLVMEYFDEKWVDLSSYVKEKGPLDLSEARNIFREIVNGVISLKRHGVVNEDLHDGNVMYNSETHEVKLIDFGLVSIFPGWKEGKSLPVKPSDSSPMTLEYKAAHPFAHLVVECEQVTGHRIQSGLVPAIQKSRLRLLGAHSIPGVENVYTWLRGGVLNGEADLDQRWLDEDCGA